jgi:cardiolipin synthase
MPTAETFREWWLALWPHVAAGTLLAINLVTTAHAVLTKRDTRGAIGWVGLVWLSPLFGAIAYWILGVNRIQRRASRLRAGGPRVERALLAAAPNAERLLEALGPAGSPMRGLAALVERTTGRELVDGNSVVPLDGGDEAYPRMLAAIHGARASIALSTYIFDNDPTGREFVEALARAKARGVEVRVLVDGIGSSYTFPSILGPLAGRGVRAERFLPASVPIYFPYANLRNHRKILVVDGAVGFTGGLNIREGCRLSRHPAHPVRDMHFEIRGPVVSHLLDVFVEDWAFAAGEELGGPAWEPVLTPAAGRVCNNSLPIDSEAAPPAEQPRHPARFPPGTSPGGLVPAPAGGGMLARGIRFGPDDGDIGRIRLVLVGALAAAQKSVRIATPYFLPDDAVCQALDVAALRGVRVEIVLPEVNNLALVGWASTALLWRVLSRGCTVWMAPPPFDHSKLMVVDRAWAMVGSGNWDERSMRLNFEFNVEVHDAGLAAALDDRIGRTIAVSRRRTLAEVDGRSLPVKLRDGVARLLSPYL